MNAKKIEELLQPIIDEDYPDDDYDWRERAMCHFSGLARQIKSLLTPEAVEGELVERTGNLLLVLEPFVNLADEAEKLGHDEESTCEWRIGAKDLFALREIYRDTLTKEPAKPAHVPMNDKGDTENMMDFANAMLVNAKHDSPDCDPEDYVSHKKPTPDSPVDVWRDEICLLLTRLRADVENFRRISNEMYGGNHSEYNLRAVEGQSVIDALESLTKQLEGHEGVVNGVVKRAEHAERRADDLQASLIASELRCQRLKAKGEGNG